MKSKKNQYLLLILVVLIWGLVIYRFFSYTASDDEIIAPIRMDTYKEEPKEEKEKYVYHLNYADPFFTSFSAPSPPVQQAPPVQKETVSIPPIQFAGIVSKGKIRTGLVKIHDRSYMVKTGDEVQGFRILRMEEEEIVARYAEADSIIHLKRNSWGFTKN